MARFTPTIPITSISNRDPELSISKDDWRRIELAYGCAVPLTARKQIRKASLTFLLFAGGEQAARPISEARDRIVKLKEAAMAFHGAVFDNSQDNGRDSRVYADHLVKGYFDDARVAAPRLRSLGLAMSSLIVACKRALAQLDNPQNHGRRSGKTWGNWVCRITDVIESHQLPIEVRKDTDKNKTGKPSPFVVLIRELQECIPIANRRATHSDGALSEAIVVARRSRGRVAKTAVPHRK